MPSHRRPRKTMSDRALQFVAQRFKVLSEPARLRLLMALEKGEQNVTALTKLTSLSQANVSKHLGILTGAAMVDRRKEGLKSFYFISDPKIIELCDVMCARVAQEYAERSHHF